MAFFKENLVFLITSLATILSLIWFVFSPSFEPLITALLGFVASIGLRPKDWNLVQRKSIRELPFNTSNNLHQEIEVNDRESVLTDEKGNSRFNWNLENRNLDFSLRFEISKPKYYSCEFDIIPIRVVTSMLVSCIGENHFFVYSYIPNKPPICFYSFQANTAMTTFLDIDDDGIPELIVGFKCGAHTEGIRIYKLDRYLNFNLIDGSDIGSDFPLITWKRVSNRFEVKSYNRNWGLNRTKWHNRFEKFVYKDLRFELESSSKVRWKEIK